MLDHKKEIKMYYATNVDGKWERCNIGDKVPFEVYTTTELTESVLQPYGVIIINDNPNPPAHDPATHGLVDIEPTQGEDGKWYANHTVVELAPVEERPTRPEAPTV